MEELRINGILMPAPKTYNVNIGDLDSDKTKRNLKGYMHRDRIRVLRKLECEWGLLTNAEVITILREVIKTEFTVTHPDPYTGGQNTLSMYSSDKKIPKQYFNSGLWQGLSFNLTEN